MIPCPFCTLRVQHAAKEDDIAQAVQKGSADVALNRLTLFQFGMLRNAAAEALHTMGFASSPDEAMNHVARLEAAPFNVFGEGARAASTAPSSAQQQPPTSLTPSRPSSGVRRHSQTARSSSGSSAVASSLRDAEVSIFAPPPPPHVTSGSRAASASSARLAPGSTNEVVVGGYVQAQSFDMEIAPPPDGHPESTVEAMELSSGDADSVWQVRAGKRKKAWKDVDEDLAEILEEAYQSGHTGCEWVYDGWIYRYDLTSMQQTSVTTGTLREIRRIRHSEAHPNTGDEDWD